MGKVCRRCGQLIAPGQEVLVTGGSHGFNRIRTYHPACADATERAVNNQVLVIAAVGIVLILFIGMLAMNV